MTYPLDIILYTFLLIIFISFVKILFGGDEDRIFQKIIGGLCVFIVAIISKNDWVFVISLFIGGLIIASENFMIFLAAIMKTSSDNIAETVNALNATKASKDEIVDKIKKEDNNILKTEQAILPEPRKSANEVTNERFQKIKKIEGLVHSFFKSKLDEDYQIQMKLTNNLGSIIVDGLVLKEGNINRIVEIRFITEKSFSIIKHLVYHLRKKLKNLDIRKRIIMVIVSEEMTLEAANTMLEENQEYADLLFFRYINDSIEPILVNKKYLI